MRAIEVVVTTQNKTERATVGGTKWDPTAEQTATVSKPTNP